MNIQKSINKIVRERERRRDKFEKVRRILILITTLFLGIFIGGFFMQSDFSITGFASGALPTVGGDSGNWGTVLNNYLSQEHTAEGGHGDITSANWTNVSITNSQVTDFNNTVWEIAGNGTLMLTSDWNSTNSSYLETSNWNSTNSSYRTLDNLTFEGDVNVTGNLNVSGTITADQFNDSSTGNQAGVMQLIETKTASNSATIDFETGIDSTYYKYVVEGSEIIAATDTADFTVRLKIDGVWKTTSYEWLRHQGFGSSSVTTSASGATSMILANNIGSDTGENLAFDLRIPNPSGATVWKILYGNFASTASAGNPVRTASTGFFNGNTNEVTGIRFLFSTGDIESGTFKLYGIK